MQQGGTTVLLRHASEPVQLTRNMQQLSRQHSLPVTDTGSVMQQGSTTALPRHASEPVQLTRNMQLLSSYTVSNRHSVSPIPVRQSSLGSMPAGTILLPADHKLPPGSVLLLPAHASNTWSGPLLQPDTLVPQNGSHLSSANCIDASSRVPAPEQGVLVRAVNDTAQGSAAAQPAVHEAVSQDGSRRLGFREDADPFRHDPAGARETASQSLTVSEGPSLQGVLHWSLGKVVPHGFPARVTWWLRVVTVACHLFHQCMTCCMQEGIKRRFSRRLYFPLKSVLSISFWS